MPRERNPNRDKAKELWLEHKGDITNRRIAELLGENEKVVAVWKQRDTWNVVQQSQKKVVQQKRGGQPGNKNAKGNRGGHGGPVRNDKAVTHGLFREFLPQDPDFLKIVDLVEHMDPLDMIWHNINTLFQKIIWSERIFFVKDREDVTKVLTKNKETDTGHEQQWQYQHAWDKLANAMKAQAVVMRELRAAIKQFLQVAPENDERRLKLEQMQQSMQIEKEKLELMKEKLEFDKKNSGGGGDDDTGNIDQLTEMLKLSAEAAGIKIGGGS